MFKIIRCIAAASAMWLVTGSAVSAEVARGSAHVATADNPVSISYALQILVSFLVVIGLILALAWLMRRTGRFGSKNTRILKIVDSLSLGMREKIILVEVNDINIVVGIAPGHIRALHVFEGNMNKQVKDNITPRNEEHGFKQLMSKFLK